MILGDYISRWVEAYAIPNQVTPIAKALDHNFYFRLRVFKDLFYLLDIQKASISSVWLICWEDQHLLKVVSENQTDWDQEIPLFLNVYRSSVHGTAGKIPEKLVFIWRFILDVYKRQYSYCSHPFSPSLAWTFLALQHSVFVTACRVAPLGYRFGWFCWRQYRLHIFHGCRLLFLHVYFLLGLRHSFLRRCSPVNLASSPDLLTVAKLK